MHFTIRLNELKEASENYLKEKQELLKQIHDAQSENTQLVCFLLL